MKSRINPMQRLLAGAGVLLLTLWASTAMAETISFLCSWDERKPIGISVDTSSMKATRNDGGYEYNVLKVSTGGVWLLVDNPRSIDSAAIQMIERAGQNGGKWVDLTTSATSGFVSAIAGGRCWEQGN
jgi:hypothetical protein